VGEEVEEQEFGGTDRARFREKLRRSLDVLARMLEEQRFDAADPMTGLEVELNLIDENGLPALRNAEVLDAIDHPDFQTELARFNVEVNIPPTALHSGGFARLETSLRERLDEARKRSASEGADLVMIGILPTLAPEHLQAPSMSADSRYSVISDQVIAARGEDIRISIEGPERLEMVADTVLPEAACTSTQLHVQVRPDKFAAYWNASQAVCSLQVAIGANSPYFLGKELWRETRIPLFEQSTDTRSEELQTQGVRPRVWFGERWVTSVFDLFEENRRYFPALIPVVDGEDPVAVLDGGGTPGLAELRLHNGTIYRWNRPVYDVADGLPHLRVENRVLAAGPTVADTMANAAFYFGLVRSLAESERPLWSRLPFATARENFHEAARRGIAADLAWPGHERIAATELVLRLLPTAREGLVDWGVEPAEADRALGVIEERARKRVNGAEWLVRRVRERSREGRRAALRETLVDYRDRMHTGEPVHTWD
jgi:gamma-glutamyl:cysteine ligase YbdK (ATP-grasp superfamily)